MIIGKGTLVLRSGRRVAIEYQFGSDYDDTRAGYLLCDTSEIDPAAFLDRLYVVCDDGTNVLVAVMHSSNQYLAVTGRAIPPVDAAA